MVLSALSHQVVDILPASTGHLPIEDQFRLPVVLARAALHRWPGENSIEKLNEWLINAPSILTSWMDQNLCASKINEDLQVQILKKKIKTECGFGRIINDLFIKLIKNDETNDEKLRAFKTLFFAVDRRLVSSVCANVCRSIELMYTYSLQLGATRVMEVFLKMILEHPYTPIPEETGSLERVSEIFAERSLQSLSIETFVKLIEVFYLKSMKSSTFYCLSLFGGGYFQQRSLSVLLTCKWEMRLEEFFGFLYSFAPPLRLRVLTDLLPLLDGNNFQDKELIKALHKAFSTNNLPTKYTAMSLCQRDCPDFQMKRIEELFSTPYISFYQDPPFSISTFRYVTTEHPIWVSGPYFITRYDVTVEMQSAAIIAFDTKGIAKWMIRVYQEDYIRNIEIRDFGIILIGSSSLRIFDRLTGNLLHTFAEDAYDESKHFITPQGFLYAKSEETVSGWTYNNGNFLEIFQRNCTGKFILSDEYLISKSSDENIRIINQNGDVLYLEDRIKQCRIQGDEAFTLEVEGESSFLRKHHLESSEESFTLRDTTYSREIPSGYEIYEIISNSTLLCLKTGEEKDSFAFMNLADGSYRVVETNQEEIFFDFPKGAFWWICSNTGFIQKETIEETILYGNIRPHHPASKIIHVDSKETVFINKRE